MPLSSDVVRRLAAIRALLRRAQQASSEAAPYSYDSLDRLHGVMELFLILAVQHYGGKVVWELDKYWDELEKYLGRPLGYRSEARKMSEARKAWRHKGVEPAVAEIEAARVGVTALLENECASIFGVALDEVSMAAFIEHDQVRERVETAQRYWREGDRDEPFADLADAFTVLMDDYQARKKLTYFGSVFGTQVDLSFARLGRDDSESRALKNTVEKTLESLQALERNVTMIGLGVDFRRYGKFRSLTPSVQYYGQGNRVVHERARLKPRSEADFDFCRDFVVSTALHLAEFDYDCKCSGARWVLRPVS